MSGQTIAYIIAVVVVIITAFFAGCSYQLWRNHIVLKRRVEGDKPGIVRKLITDMQFVHAMSGRRKWRFNIRIDKILLRNKQKPNQF